MSIQQQHIAAIQRGSDTFETLADVLASISAPQLNLDAPAQTGYTNNDVMSSGWNDVSGNARHLLATGLGVNGVPPKWLSSVQNGLPAVHYDGGGGVNRTYLRLATQNLNTGWGITTAWTSYCAFKCPANHNGGIFYWDNGTSPFSVQPYWSDGNAYVQAGAQAGGQFLAPDIGDTPTTWEIWCCHGTSAATWEIMRNGASAFTQTRTNTVPSASAQFLVGGYTSLNVAAAEYFIGHIGDIIIFNTDHDGTTRTRMNNALMRRWGLL